MRDKALLGLMVLLAGMGALVNFTSAILSFLADAMMMGGAVACAVLVYRHMNGEIKRLERENADLRMLMGPHSAHTQAADRAVAMSDRAGARRMGDSMFGRNRSWGHE